MSYESDPAGLGVGKRYGPLKLGGVQGAMKGYGKDVDAIFEVTFDELDASAAQVVKVPAYGKVTGVYVEVEEVFGTGDTLDVTLDGTSLLTAELAVSALGIVEGSLSATAADLTAGATAEDLVVDVTNVDAGTPETGKCKVVVTYKAV
jgi:hypothetical protein